MVSNIEFKDIQGLIVRGYNELPASCFLLLNITDVVKARQWLRIISEEITDGISKPTQKAVQVAFTYAGIKNWVWARVRSGHLQESSKKE